MARLTITLSEELHRELRVKAAGRGETIGTLIQRAFDDQKELAYLRVQEIMQKAWDHAEAVRPEWTEDQVMAEALDLVREVREKARSGRQARDC